MNHDNDSNERNLRVRTPCPKSWNELSGEGAKRFCSECSLHVHDAAQLTRREAERLVAEASERVCMRMTLDESGAPIYRDTPPSPTLVERWKRWALPAAAGLLAACNGSDAGPAPTPIDVGAQDPPIETTKMGEVGAPEVLGDVAIEPRSLEVLGEVCPAPNPPGDAPPHEDGDGSKP